MSDADLLHTPMPAFPADAVLPWLARTYGIEADRADGLPSERDQILRLPDAVVKISNSAERRSTLDMENGALAHLARVDPTLPVPRIVPSRAGEPVEALTDAAGLVHLVRVQTVVPGRHLEGAPISTRLAERIGAISARVSVALRGYFHPDAGRRLDWDIRVRRSPAVDENDPVSLRLARARARIDAALDATAALPAGVQHADATLTNLLGEDEVVTGVVDFGDMHHTAAVCDLAVSLTSVLRNSGPPVAPWSELAAAFLDGYQRVRPLLPEEAAILGHLVLARLVTTLDISRGRVDEHPDNREYILQYDGPTDRLLTELVELSDEDLAYRFSRLVGLPTPRPVGDLAGRRAAALGGALSPLFYAQPIRLASGSGPWLIGDEGEAYLDAYNNVAVAGHTQPAITQAVTHQLRTLNTHSRYLHPAVVELAERLTATMPDGLDTCVFVTSGSEAVDLAWRMARAYTGAGGTLIAEWAYHGISTRTFDFSTNEWPAGAARPADVATYRAPHDGESTLDGDEARRRVRRAASEVDGCGLLIVDPQFTSEGILDAPTGFMAGLVDGIHAEGGLFLADEVQSGFGRSGPALWRFAAQGITPDLVTLGKPMAAGLPVGAVITRREIADKLGYEYFSTFAGSPVAGAAGVAVLDVLADRRIPERAVRVGEHLRGRVRELAVEYPVITAVRGYGLIAGIPLRGGRSMARSVVEALRQRRVLAGATGPGGDVLKVRPPLVWEEEHADLFVTALRDVLRTLT